MADNTSPDSSSRVSIYHRVLRYLRPYRRLFILSLVCMVIFGASDGAIPFIVKYILDGVFADQDTSLLKVLPVVIVVFAVIRAAVDFGQQFLMARVGYSIVQDLRNELNAKILSFSPGYFARESSGNLLARITSDVMLVKTLLTDSVSGVIRDVIRIIALTCTAVYLDPFLAIIGLIVFPIGIFPVYRFGKRVRKLSKHGQDLIGNLSGMLNESILGNRVVKVFGREKTEQEKFEKENHFLTKTFLRSERIRAITGPVNEVLASLVISGVILYGGYTVIGGIRSQGDFVAFLLALFLLYDPFKKLGKMNNTVQQGISGAERIFEILDQEPEIQDPIESLPLPSDLSIELRNVTFSYGNEAVLKDLSLSIRKGERIALVGFSGSGKSTFVDLIPRFIDPDQGEVLLGGVSVSKLRLSELRSQIAMVSQHTFLFHDSIRANIAYGKASATGAEILAAAQAAYAEDFINQLPEGIDTVIGESGMTLSGGERQRIAIARAILKDAPILILDEATASLDNRAEREVQQALEVLEENRTSIVIAHRLSTVRNADRIVVLKEGKIVEVGTHEDLLSHGEEYSKLYALQFNDPGDERPRYEAAV